MVALQICTLKRGAAQMTPLMMSEAIFFYTQTCHVSIMLASGSEIYVPCSANA